MIRKTGYVPSSFTKENYAKTAEKQVSDVKESDVKNCDKESKNYSADAKANEEKTILSAEKRTEEKSPQTPFNMSAVCAVILSAMLKNKNMGI